MSHNEEQKFVLSGEQVRQRVFDKRNSQENHIVALNSMDDAEKEEMGYSIYLELSEKTRPKNLYQHMEKFEYHTYMVRSDKFWNTFCTLRENYEKEKSISKISLLRSVLNGHKLSECNAKPRRVLFDEDVQDNASCDNMLPLNSLTEQRETHAHNLASNEYPTQEIQKIQEHKSEKGESMYIGFPKVHEKVSSRKDAEIIAKCSKSHPSDNVIINEEQHDAPDNDSSKNIVVSKMEARKQALLAQSAKRREVSSLKGVQDPKPSARKVTNKTNRNVIQNALKFCVFPGTVNEMTRKKILLEIDNSFSKHFLVLFRDKGLQYRGIYTWDEKCDVVEKMCGSGPSVCSQDMINLMFKYDYGGKKFSSIPAKQFDSIYDGFTIQDNYWMKKPNVTRN